ncbi:MAG: sigma-70 family RNA polymerase sigma factor [Lentisphaeria bacterium]|nr:sigma-70 family RNA polymerase sigma factor [Lentisphaeria bacterium]
MSFTTDVSFLEKISEGDEVSWEKFKEIYSPLIRFCGHEWGLTDLEIEDLVQDVMISFFMGSKTFRYDRSKGKFRSYLQEIAKNKVFTILRKKQNLPVAADENITLMDYAFDDKWDSEWHKYLCAEAFKLLRKEMEPISFRSFHMYVMEEIPPNKVAAELGISVNAVYINKCRALEHLRRTIRELEKL